MGKKPSGHFCYRCGENRPNEKFSGKGHRQHICKECKKAGRDKIEQISTPEKYSEQY